MVIAREQACIGCGRVVWRVMQVATGVELV